MDTRTGDIFTGKALEELLRDNKTKPFLKPINLSVSVAQKLKKPIDKRAIGRIGRNDKCPCGSGKKFKFCCLNI